MRHLGKICVIVILLMCAACSKTPESKDKTQQQLQQQEAQQGYPVLIAMPEIADYALPFCEKKYCIEAEIFSFKSQDQWFNAYSNQQIADLIRKQLGLSQKLSLQAAVDTFVQMSDAWQAEDEKQNSKAWTMYIKPRIAMQQGEIALLVIHAEFDLGKKVIPAQDYFFVVDRKQQKTLRLYDVVREQERQAFTLEMQTQYQNWKNTLTEEQQVPLPEKIYWANQDWFFDEQGIAIYYRGSDFGLDAAKNLTIYLTPEQSKAWVNVDVLRSLNLPE